MRQAWLPAAPEGARQARAVVRDATAELRLDGETTWELMLATTEAFANALEHGVPCPSRGILLRVENRDGSVGVEVCDCGGNFPETPRSSKPEGEGGRGIPIIQAIMDRLEVAPDSEATRVRFEKRVALAV
jgi:anti-sigma regulatory factor (Ser/Thr protein kinase)